MTWYEYPIMGRDSHSRRGLRLAVFQRHLEPIPLNDTLTLAPALRSRAATARARARLADIGLSRLGCLLVALDIGVLVVDVVLFAASGLSLRWSTAAVGAGLIATIFAVWFNFYLMPSAKDRFAAQVVFLVGVLLSLTNVGSAMQYGAVALGAPYADGWLAAADARLGVHVPTLAAWTAAHPIVRALCTLAYGSLTPQFFATIIILAAYKDRDRLWEFAFHFHVCLILTLAALIIWPAVCPPAHYGFTPTIDMTRLIRQIKDLHEGTMTVVRFDQLEGLVSFPSFHVAGALIVTWAFRSRRWWLIPIACLNAALIAATFVTGVHYVIDVIASVPLVGGSVWLYRRYGVTLGAVDDTAS